jgi:hypothetical protein
MPNVMESAGYARPLLGCLPGYFPTTDWPGWVHRVGSASAILLGREDVVFRSTIREIRGPLREHRDYAIIQGDDAPSAIFRFASADAKLLSAKVNLKPTQQSQLGKAKPRIEICCDRGNIASASNLLHNSQAGVTVVPKSDIGRCRFSPLAIPRPAEVRPTGDACEEWSAECQFRAAPFWGLPAPAVQRYSR